MDPDRRIRKILIVILAIPVLAFLVSAGIQSNLDANMRKALLTSYPDKANIISTETVTDACRNPDARSDQGFGPVCVYNDKMQWLNLGAVIAALTGVLMLFAIRVAGDMSRKRRELLLSLFGPGLHLTMLGLSGLMILQAVLGVAAVYYAGSALTHEIPIGLIFGLALGAFIGVASLIRAQLATIQKPQVKQAAKQLTRSTYPRLWEFVETLADQMGAQRPQAIIAGLEPNFYVTEAQVNCDDARLQGRTLYLSASLCRILSVNELRAVLAHELGHYKGQDTEFSKHFFPIYRGASLALVNLSIGIRTRVGASYFVQLPAFAMLTYFLGCFAVAEKDISRDRELAADNEAAKAVSPKDVATALLKVNAFSPAWSSVRKQMMETVKSGEIVPNASTLFRSIVYENVTSINFSNVSQEGPVHPTDTHPPFSARLENLKLSFADVGDNELRNPPQPCAIDLIENSEELEQELTRTALMFILGPGRLPIPVETGTAPATP